MVRNGVDRKWYGCNDSEITEGVFTSRGDSVDGGNVHRLPGDVIPYILFYQKVQANMSAPRGETPDEDTPDTKALRKATHTTPKRPQRFAPNACKQCGAHECKGSCVQCL